ncbi:MAG: hypothetical protein HC836_11610 [Richelia sp. RM2_1_2]|uniref:Uncharacterized protein n=1 Tax=Plectonema cf. radiosum LEGE 06105 TaxID=945769 RepID=A0A8J7F5T4_9CYAN|nr:hypothetical protein [Plectonema radiosum]MBF2013769.1 hypothetical protein [Rivularia sp. T60_A2020_040]NJL79407.1 hypothetical protein [Richelia sp. SM2_1_7]NJM17469.1 hypothetical protein [Richelia sp. SM1_7_0]NJN06530.1 hypothetical protein [Richelia sp. RM1_1_1]NJO26262.1 hypothetical protein [Richelia sp. SL_2_1]NJO58954.1 hypothetical protein [Richelia sp. RM2_1_2]NJS16266.1 hypothetical protein [Nostocaceae cyanobacterium CSU_2_110]
MFKRKNLTLVMLTCLGMGYFLAMSSLSINPFLKSQAALIPFQISVVIYFTYLRWHRHKEFS